MEALPIETAIPIELAEKPAPKGTSYAAKKSVAQRMMDIALLTSNANQLRYVLQYGESSGMFAVSVTLIALSLFLQVAVGIYLIFRIRPSSTASDKEKAHSVVVAGVFLITIVNVLVTAFNWEPIYPPGANGTIFNKRIGDSAELP